MHTRLPRLLALVAGLAALSLPTVAFAQESTTTLTATLTGGGDPWSGRPRRRWHRHHHPAAGPGLLQHDLGQHWRRHPSPHPQGCTGGGPIVVTLFDVADPLPRAERPGGLRGCRGGRDRRHPPEPGRLLRQRPHPRTAQGRDPWELQASSQLPFTGSSSRSLLVFALSLMAAGVLLLAAVRRYAPAHARRLSGPRRRAATTPGLAEQDTVPLAIGRRGPPLGRASLVVEPPWGHTPPVPSGQR